MKKPGTDLKNGKITGVGEDKYIVTLTGSNKKLRRVTNSTGQELLLGNTVLVGFMDGSPQKPFIRCVSNSLSGQKPSIVLLSALIRRTATVNINLRYYNGQLRWYASGCTLRYYLNIEGSKTEDILNAVVWQNQYYQVIGGYSEYSLLKPTMTNAEILNLRSYLYGDFSEDFARWKTSVIPILDALDIYDLSGFKDAYYNEVLAFDNQYLKPYFV